MHIVIPELIPASLAGELRAALLRAPFVDGRYTVGDSGSPAKSNLELTETRTLPVALAKSLVTALKTAPLLVAWALPRRAAPFLFNRYDEGMYYRDHVDNALNPAEGSYMRSDVSITVFLSAPEDYQGGELVIDSDGAALGIKLPAGHALAYSADTMHRVEPVTGGTRLAAVTWIESLVPQADRRKILFDLVRSIEEVDAQAQPALRMRLEKCRANLLRMWARP